MKQDPEQENQTPPAPKRRMSDFLKALIVTAIVSFITGVGLVAAIGAFIYFLVKGKREIVAGIAAGIGITIVAWGVTCFALSASWG